MVNFDILKTKHHGKTEFRRNGTIKAFHIPTTQYRRVVTEKDIKDAPKGFKISIQINRYNQIHDIQPRVFGGKCLFDTYHGRQGEKELQALIFAATELYAREHEDNE